MNKLWFIEYNPKQNAWHIDDRRMPGVSYDWIRMNEINGEYSDAKKWTDENRKRIEKEFKKVLGEVK